ncbi:MAG: glycosyltransferase family 4 protein [Bryobacteraceae bacterium]
MSRKLRFLHITTFYPPYNFGGDGLFVYRLCQALGEAGHEVHVIHCVNSYEMFRSARPEIEFPHARNVTVTSLRSALGWLAPLCAHQFGLPLVHRRRIQAILDGTQFDVIHYHNISLFGPGILRMQPANPCLKLYTTHEHWLICPMHVLWKNDERPCEKPDCFSCMVRGGRPPQVWRWTGMLAKASRHVDLFLAPSRFTADMHQTRGFQGPFAVLPYFAPGNTAAQRRVERPHPRPYFLFVGRLEKIKGLQTVIESWPDDLDCDLLVAGSGDYGPELRRLAAGNPRVSFLGLQSQDQLGSLYTHALASLVPSLTYETFGIVCIESFLNATPVIAHDLGALRDLIQESGGGLLYTSREEFQAALRSLASSPDLRRQLGTRGLAASQRLWTRDVHLSAYFKLIRETAAGKFGAVPWEAAEGVPAPAD